MHRAALPEHSLWWLYDGEIARHDVGGPRKFDHLVDVGGARLANSPVAHVAGHKLRKNCLGQCHDVRVEAGVLDSKLEEFGPSVPTVIRELNNPCICTGEAVFFLY